MGKQCCTRHSGRARKLFWFFRVPIGVFRVSDLKTRCEVDGISIFASDNLVLFRADFPKRKKNKLPEAQQAANDRLADQYNPKGYFPLVLVFSPDQQLLSSFAYEKPVKAYIDQIAAL